LKKYFFSTTGGFFIEAGANDAESGSDSLHFELNRGWKVFVAICHPHSFGYVLTKKREISRTFALKKCELLSRSSFGRFCQKCELFVKVRAISRF
jgi:hypothetical protein